MRRSRGLQGLTALVAGVGVTLAGACARQGAPPGGPEDRRPPVVVLTEPDTYAVVDSGFRGPIRFHFDERISERAAGGSLEDLVVISPATGDVRVGHGRRAISIELDGGFQPGIVYRVTLLPGLADLFNNAMGDPFELVFSTGGTFTPTAVAGLAWDRITGEGLEEISVQAVSSGEDTVVHLAETDTAGVYAFRYLPVARYRIVAFQDRNRDGILDPTEAQGTRGVLLNNPNDTVFLPIALLTPDTTPARLTSVELLDSLTLAVEFDDFLDAEMSLANVGASLSLDTAALSADTAALAGEVEVGAPPSVYRLFHAYEYRAWVEQVADSFARLDSLDALVRQAEASAEPAPDTAAEAAADPLPDDSTQVAPEPAEARRVPPVELPGGRREEAIRPDGSEAPSQTIVIVLSDGLTPNQPYRLAVTGVTNIANVPQGGGETPVILSPPPDTTTADSLAVLDSLAAEDTLAVPDTSLVPPDTGGVALHFLDAWRRPKRP